MEAKRPKRDRLQLNPAEKEACSAFRAAMDRAGINGPAIAEVMKVTPGMVSHWRNGRAAIPAIRAIRLSALVDEDPELISSEYAILKQHFGASQPPRLDPQMMAEALVAVLKAQERDKRAFKPGHIARALTAIYEIRTAFKPNMTKSDLKSFDKMVMSNLDKVWGELNAQAAGTGTISYSSGVDTRAA